MTCIGGDTLLNNVRQAQGCTKRGLTSEYSSYIEAWLNPYTSLPMHQAIAPVHVGHGSVLLYIVAPANCSLTNLGNSWRNAFVSACPNGSDGVATVCIPSASTTLFAPTTTAP